MKLGASQIYGEKNQRQFPKRSMPLGLPISHTAYRCSFVPPIEAKQPEHGRQEEARPIGTMDLFPGSAAKPGTVVIDMSSIDPVESKKIGAELAEKGIELMDAPVSGGEPKAIDGTLSVMVGGKKETFDKYYELLMQMAGSVVYVGELGSGNVAKLANQVIVALNIAAVSEALTLAKKAGTDPELVYQAIRGGLAGSTVLDAKAPMMMDHNFKPGFRIELHIKDLNNALN